MTIRKYNPGDEWVYVKIYAGPLTLEKVLIRNIHDLAGELFKEQQIEKYFFIRYIDDFHHLRVRFKVTSPEGAYRTMSRIKAALSELLESKLIWNITFSPYNRELERYGEENIDDCETLFCYNSLYVTGLLRYLYDNESDAERWVWACRSIDMLLGHFGLPAESRSHFLQSVVDGYAPEYNLSKGVVRKLNDKFRDFGSRLEANLNAVAHPTDIPDPVIDRACKEAVQRIGDRHNGGTLSVPLPALLQSLIHMNLNRLFSTRQRKSEFVVCYLMNKYYKSQTARQKAGKANYEVVE